MADSMAGSGAAADANSGQRPGGRLFVVSAPSGAGKTTLTDRLRARGLVKISVSHTTRPPRDGEQNGVQYFFTAREEFLRMRDAGAFLEWAEVFGHFYGTEKTWVRGQLAARANILLEIDVQGAEKIRAEMPEAVSIFIRPPSMDALLQRLNGRGKDSPESVRRRFAAAQSEMARAKSYDHVIINDDLERATAEICDIVMQHSNIQKKEQHYGQNHY